MLDSLSVGQKVVTQAGIYGTVAQLGEKTIKLKVADNVRIEVPAPRSPGRSRERRSEKES